jgi:hypothetical protein
MDFSPISKKTNGFFRFFKIMFQKKFTTQNNVHFGLIFYELKFNLTNPNYFQME